VRAQARANGYTDTETRQLLRADDLLGAERIRVPTQGDLFGGWPGPGPAQSPDADNTVSAAKSPPTPDTPASEPTPDPAVDIDPDPGSWVDRPATNGSGCHSYPEPLDDPDPESTVDPDPESTVDPDPDDWLGLSSPITSDPSLVGKVDYLDDDGDILDTDGAVRAYIGKRHGERTSAERHGMTDTLHSRAESRYSRGKQMDRHAYDNFDDLSTVMISLRVSPTTRERLTMLSALHDALGPTMDAIRYRLQTAPDAPVDHDEWEYIVVFSGTRERATPHVHIYLWIDADVSRGRFRPAVETFVNKCDFAPDDGYGNNPQDGTISVRGNGDDVVPTMDDAPDESAGATYVLKQLPHHADVDRMCRDELLHSMTCDAWSKNVFRWSSLGDEIWNGDGG
jgi:hypothetical protein